MRNKVCCVKQYQHVSCIPAPSKHHVCFFLNNNKYGFQNKKCTLQNEKKVYKSVLPNFAFMTHLTCYELWDKNIIKISHEMKGLKPLVASCHF